VTGYTNNLVTLPLEISENSCGGTSPCGSGLPRKLPFPGSVRRLFSFAVAFTRPALPLWSEDSSTIGNVIRYDLFQPLHKTTESFAGLWRCGDAHGRRMEKACHSPLRLSEAVPLRAEGMGTPRGTEERVLFLPGHSTCSQGHSVRSPLLSAAFGTDPGAVQGRYESKDRSITHEQLWPLTMPLRGPQKPSPCQQPRAASRDRNLSPKLTLPSAHSSERDPGALQSRERPARNGSCEPPVGKVQ